MAVRRRGNLPGLPPVQGDPPFGGQGQGVVDRRLPPDAPMQGQGMGAGEVLQYGAGRAQGQEGRALRPQVPQELPQAGPLPLRQRFQVIQEEQGGRQRDVLPEGGFYLLGLRLQPQALGQLGQQLGGGAGPVLLGAGAPGEGHAAGEAPGVAVGRLYEQTGLADARRAGNHPARRGRGQGAGQVHQFPPPAEEEGGAGREVAGRTAVVHHRLPRPQVLPEAESGIAQQEDVVGGDGGPGAPHRLPQGEAVGQFGVEAPGEGHRFGVPDGKGMAHDGAGPAGLQQRPSHGAGVVRGRLAAVEDDQVQGTGQALQHIQQFFGRHGVDLAPFVLQKEAPGPGVAAEVEDVGEDVLLFGARGEGGAQRVQRGRGQAGQEDGGVAPPHGPGQSVPLLLQVQGRREGVGPVGVVDWRGQQGQDAQHAGGVLPLQAGRGRRLQHHLPGLDDDVLRPRDQDGTGHIAGDLDARARLIAHRPLLLSATNFTNWREFCFFSFV